MEHLSHSRTAVVLAIISFVILPIIFLYPFHSDIDIQQVMGFEVARYHVLPYLGCWDSNFPGTIVIHAATILLFGNSEFDLRLTDFLFQIASVLVLYRIARFWIDRTPSQLGILFYALFYVRGPGQYISQRDCFAILPILLGIWLNVSASRSRAGRQQAFFVFLAGACIGIATWIRPTFGLLLAVPFVSLFELRSQTGRIIAGFELLGFTIIISGGLLPYVLTPGGLHAIYFATIRYNIEVYSHTFSFHDYSRRAWVALGFLAVWAAAVLYHRSNKITSRYAIRAPQELRFIIAVIIALLTGVAMMRRLASYHFAPFFACFMPILAAVIWEQLMRFANSTRTSIIATSIVLLYPWNGVLQFIAKGKTTNTVATVIAKYVESHSRPSDRVELATFTAPGPRWHIRRPFATRFTTVQSLLITLPSGDFTSYQQSWRAQYVRKLQAEKPKFYIVDDPIVPKSQPTTLELLYTLPGLKSLLTESYHCDTIIGNYLIFRRIPDSNLYRSLIVGNLTRN